MRGNLLRLFFNQIELKIVSLCSPLSWRQASCVIFFKYETLVNTVSNMLQDLLDTILLSG